MRWWTSRGAAEPPRMTLPSLRPWALLLALGGASVLALAAPSRAAPAAVAPTRGSLLSRELSLLARRLWVRGAEPDVASQAIRAARAWRDGHRASALRVLKELAASLREGVVSQDDASIERTTRAEAEVLSVGARAALAENRVADVLYFLESSRASALDSQLALSAEEDAPFDDDAGAATIALLESREASARKSEALAFAGWRLAYAGGNLTGIRRAREALDAARDRSAAARERLDRARRAAAGEVVAPPATIHDLRFALRGDEALVHYALLADEAWALVVRPHDVQAVSLGTTSDVLRAVHGLRLDDPDDDAVAATARLRAAIVAPLGLDGSTRRVVFVPDGRLAGVPFALLVPDRIVSLVPSGSVWLRLMRERHPEGHGVLAIGGPDYGTSPAGLPLPLDASGVPPESLAAASAEVRRVGDQVHMGPDATETALRRALAGDRSWAAIHVACHGLLAETAAGCALALAPSPQDDGLLTVPEIEDLDVRSELVVLSACHTGEGPVIDPEGCISLARAFLAAGAPRVIASLGTVDDEATAALMERFYAFWRQGIPAADALRQAQAHVRSQPRWSHPHFWACWTVLGTAD